MTSEAKKQRFTPTPQFALAPLCSPPITACRRGAKPSNGASAVRRPISSSEYLPTRHCIPHEPQERSPRWGRAPQGTLGAAPHMPTDAPVPQPALRRSKLRHNNVLWRRGRDSSRLPRSSSEEHTSELQPREPLAAPLPPAPEN